MAGPEPDIAIIPAYLKGLATAPDKLGGGAQKFGPGYYNWVADVGIPNDQISSFRAVDY